MRKYLLLVLCIITGCTTNEKSYVPTILFAESSGQMLTPEYKFIILETTEDNLLGRIEKVEFVDDRIFILDLISSQTLHLYSKDGNFITKIGNKGTAPSEYTTPNNFWIEEDNGIIRLLDHMTNRFIIYDLYTYEYIKTIPIPFCFHSFIKVSNNEYLWYNKAFGYETAKGKYYLQTTDSLFQSKDFYIKADFLTSIGIGGRSAFYNYNNTVYFYQPYDPVIYQLTSDGIIESHQIKIPGQEFPSVNYLNNLAGKSGNYDYTKKLIHSGYIAAYLWNETDETIALHYYYCNNNVNVILYDKKSGESSSFVEFKDEYLANFLSLTFVGVYDNKFISYISPGRLETYSIKNKELKSISENLPEDSNPILCLIKYKKDSL